MSRFLSTLVCALFVTSLIAGGAQAATIIKKDGLTYKLKGDLQLQLRQDPGDDQNVDIEYDDLEIKNSISYELNENLQAFGQLDFGFKDAADKDNQDNPELEEAYVGMAYDKVSVLFGKTDNSVDGFGIYGGIESYLADDAFDYVGQVSGDDLILAEIGFENFTVTASHELEAENEDSENGSSTEIRADFSMAGFSLQAAYQSYEETPEADSIDTYGISLAYDAEFVVVGADYSIADDDSDETAVWNICVSAPVAETTTVGAGYKSLEFDDDAIEDLSSWYANVVYKFPSQKNVSVFAELGDTDEDNVDPGALVGLRVKF